MLPFSVGEDVVAGLAAHDALVQMHERCPAHGNRFGHKGSRSLVVLEVRLAHVRLKYRI